MIKKDQDLREVYVWQLPVRIFHWTNAMVIVGLCITGYIIGNPPAIQHGTPPADNYWFGIVRFVHLVCAMLFIVNFLIRCYWFFAGNKFAQWYNYIPLKRKQWRGIKDTLKVDVLLITKKPIYDIGHNSLAATTYGIIFIVMILQMFTGMMMFSVQSGAFWAPFFRKILILLDGFFPVRNLHHWLMWIFIIFAIIHIYLVFYHDYIEKNGIASSIIGGWKFIARPIVNDMEAENAMEHNVKMLEKQVKELKREKEVKRKKII